MTKVLDVAPLPLWLSPEPDESLLSFYFRTLQRNMLKTSVIGRDKNWVWLTKAAFDPAIVSAICTMCRLDRARGLEMSHLMTSRGGEEGLEQPFPRYVTCSSNLRFCPECVRQKAYHRRVWDFRVLDICVEHELELLSGCSCGMRFTWRNSWNFECCCGVKPDAQPRIVVSAHLVRKLTPLRNLLVGDGVGVLSPQLDQMALDQKLSAILLLGRFSRDAGTISGLSRATLSREDRRSILIDGLAICSDWPAGFMEMMERIRTGSKTGKPFGHVRRYVTRFKGTQLGDLLSEALEEYVGATARNAKDALTSSPLIGLVEVKGMLAVSDTTLRKILKMSEGEVERRTIMNRPVYRRDQVEELRMRWLDLITGAEAGRILGLGSRTCAKLVDEGMLQRQFPAQGLKRERYVFGRTDVERLLSRLLSCVRHGTVKPARTSIRSFEQLYDAVPAVSIVKAVVEGSLIPIGLAARKRGLTKLLFDKDAALAWKAAQLQPLQAAT